MGSFATLQFNGYQIASTKDYLDEWLFKKIDQKKLKRRRNGGEDEEDAYVFETSVDTMIKRLEADGITLKAAKIDFKKCIAEAVKRNDKRSELFGDESSRFIELKRAAFLKPFEEWKAAIKTIFEEKLEEIDLYKEPCYQPIKAHSDDLINYMLNANREGEEYLEGSYQLYVLGYPASQFSYFARVALEALDTKANILLDATDLVRGGNYDGFELLENIQRQKTSYYETLSSSLDDLAVLSDLMIDDAKKPLLRKLIFVGSIATMEAYLSDTLVNTVQRSEPAIRRLVENENDFSNKEIKIKASQLFSQCDNISKEAIIYLQKLIYHKLAEVKRIYKEILLVDFPNISHLIKAINIRHGIVHRNGKADDGKIHIITSENILSLINDVRNLARHVDQQIINIYKDMWQAGDS